MNSLWGPIITFVVGPVVVIIVQRFVHRDNRRDHAQVVEELKNVTNKVSDIGADVRDVKADVREVKNAIRLHEHRLEDLEHPGGNP